MIIKRNAISKLIIHLLSSNSAQKKKNPIKPELIIFPIKEKCNFHLKVHRRTHLQVFLELNVF